MMTHQTDPLAIRMAESTPRLFVAFALFMLISAGAVLFFLARDLLPGAPEEQAMFVNEGQLNRGMQHMLASTHRPQTHNFVQDRKQSWRGEQG